MKPMQQLEAEIIFLRGRLERVIELSVEAQGDWTDVQIPYAPEWTTPFKDIAEVAELALSETQAVQS